MTASFTFAAIKARMGSTEYFQASVRARDLAAMAGTVGETEDWERLSISERYQRELAERRIRDEIVPYLVRSRDRFFGALILVVRDPHDLTFEPLTDYLTSAPAAVSGALKQVGVLTLRAGRSCVVLDGQHRFAALRAATSDQYHVEGEYRGVIADDELTIIFIPFEDVVKTRRIFNKVNRYAKPTNPSDNIITSEDDGYAIVARWLVDTEPPLGLATAAPPLNLYDARDDLLVEWKSTKLEQDSMKLTTLLAVYQSVEVILQAMKFPALDEQSHVNRPPDNVLSSAYLICAEWWAAMLAGLTAFRSAVKRPYMIPDMRKYQERYSLLFRPIAQVALVRGLADAVAHGLSLSEAVERANAVSWKASGDQWVNTIIFANGRMNTRKSAIHLAGNLIAYLISADHMTEQQVSRLQYTYAEARGLYSRKLPQPVKAARG